MDKVNFGKWVNEMYRELTRTHKYTFDKLKDNIIICYNKRNGKVGIARCHPDDNFNYQIGVAISYARCRGYKVPKITERFLHEMKYGEKFKYDYNVYTFLCKIPDSNCYAVKETHSKCRLYNFADIQVEMVE